MTTANAEIIEIAAALNVNPDWQVYPAARQREIFGFAIFGKRAIKLSRDGRGIDVYRRVDYGRDYNISTFSWAEIAKLVANRDTVVGHKD